MKEDLWLRLSDAGRQLICELAAGKSMKQVAHALGISTRAVHFRWQSCRERLGCETPAQAIALLAGDSLPPLRTTETRTNARLEGTETIAAADAFMGSTTSSTDNIGSGEQALVGSSSR